MSDRGPTILIITAGQLSRNPRVYKEALALGAAGYNVTVLFVRNVAAFDHYDRELLSHANFNSIYIDHLSPERTLRHRANLDRFRTRLARYAVKFGVSSPDAFGPYRTLLRRATAHPADLTIVHTETAFAVGRVLMKRGRLVSGDFEDWHSQDLLPRAQRDRPTRLLVALERSIMQRSVYTSTTSVAMSDALASAYASRPPVVVRNTFPCEAHAAPRDPNNPIMLLWFSQTIGPGRGLEALVAAWAKCERPSRLTLMGECVPSFADVLRELAGNAQARLVFRPPVSPIELPRKISRHDLGLALEQTIPKSRNLTITNKLFQYANGGLGILASGTAGQREALALAPRSGVILTTDCIRTLSQQLDSIIGDPARIVDMRRAASEASQTAFSWISDRERLLTSVASALRAHAIHPP